MISYDDNRVKICDVDGDFLSTKEARKVVDTLHKARNLLSNLHGLKATDIPGTDKMPENEEVIMTLNCGMRIRLIDLALRFIEENSHSEMLSKSEIMNTSIKISEALSQAEHDFSFSHGLIAFDDDKKPFSIDTTEINKSVHEAICILDRLDDSST